MAILKYSVWIIMSLNNIKELFPSLKITRDCSEFVSATNSLTILHTKFVSKSTGW